MLIYEKKVLGERHLFGTLGNIPGPDDVQLTYKDNAGTSVDVSALNFFYNKAKCIYGNDSVNQLPSDNDTKINVWLGDTLIIGNVETCAVTCNEIDNVVITVASEVAKGAETTISIAPATGYEFDDQADAPTATANGEAVTLTLDDGAYVGSFTVDADTAVVVTATVKVSG